MLTRELGPGASADFKEEKPGHGEEGPNIEPLNNLGNTVEGQKGDVDFTDVTLACEHGHQRPALSSK